MLRMIKKWQLRRKTYEEMSKLSDAELKDLGLSRSALPYIIEQELKRIYG